MQTRGILTSLHSPQPEKRYIILRNLLYCMSLHIESTEDALAELKKQRVKTLTAAISVSFLGVALMGLLLYLVHIIVAIPEDPPMVAYATQEGDNPDIDTPEVTQTTQRPSSSSTAAQVKVIAAVATADVAVVNPDIEVDVPSEELSMGIDIGDGFGTGTGDGDGGGIPGIISKRCDLNDRMKRITETGALPSARKPWSNPSSGSRSSRTRTAPGAGLPRITSAP